MELDTIRDIALSVPGALGVHDISVHSYGLDKFVSIHAEINAKKSAAEAHDISTYSSFPSTQGGGGRGTGPWILQ